MFSFTSDSGDALAHLSIPLSILLSGGFVGMLAGVVHKLFVLHDASRDSKQALEQSNANAKDILIVKAEQQSMQVTIAGICEQVKKLDMLPTMMATLDSLSRTVNSNMVPRMEHEHVWNQVKDLAQEIKEIHTVATEAKTMAHAAMQHNE